jgi:hypothetical protein
MVKQFKSERAAKSAYTKAEKAHFSARNTLNAWKQEQGALPYVEESDVGEWADEARAILAKLAELTKAVDDAFEAMRQIYEMAQSQDFFVSSYHFGHNPTRDLIAANID